MVTPAKVPNRPVPASPTRRRGATSATDLVHLVVDVVGGALEGPLEGNPHGSTEKGHYQHRDSGS